jgi:hypothetical protein
LIFSQFQSIHCWPRATRQMRPCHPRQTRHELPQDLTLLSWIEVTSSYAKPNISWCAVCIAVNFVKPCPFQFTLMLKIRVKYFLSNGWLLVFIQDLSPSRISRVHSCSFASFCRSHIYIFIWKTAKCPAWSTIIEVFRASMYATVDAVSSRKFHLANAVECSLNPFRIREAHKTRRRWRCIFSFFFFFFC